ncbi:MAG: iron-containing alcohol dehydrogenase [Salinivirgaceae bacterium]|nr:iron-containing alcohol dehydrogenase [Salinivirgaceae bacterium]
MQDFKYYAPTEVIFGRNSETQIAAMVQKYGGKKVLIHYGGQSAERSGLLAVVRKSLDSAGIAYVELGGVVPNPRLSLVRKGIELCKAENVDFLLAVGGGSVIDSIKAIGYGLDYKGDVWDLFIGKGEADTCRPLGVVLTIPAAGSEMSEGCVITKEAEQEPVTSTDMKRSYDVDLCRPRFAIMNPERTLTLPPFQTACGITDIMMHTMERYFSHDDDMLITDAVAESILKTVRHCGPKVLADPSNYHLRAQIMWAGSIAHNGLTGCGTTGDWATHNIEHELSALYNVAHGAGLAAIWPHWAEYALDENPTRFAQFAVNVLDVPNNFRSAKETAIEGIAAMKQFYHSIGMPTSIQELIGRKATEEEMQLMADKCSIEKTSTVGNLKKLAYSDILKIYQLANR